MANHKSKHTDAVIFDVDGTLIDSVDLHARAWEESFAHFGLLFPYEKIRSQIGKGSDQLLPVFLSQGQIEEFGKAVSEYKKELFQNKYFERVRPFPGVRELFLKLKAENRAVGLASSASAEELEGLKQVAGISDLIEMETDADDAERSKPHPDIFEAAIARLDRPSLSKVVVIGDTPYDAHAANRAGVKAVGFMCGGYQRDELMKAGCLAVLGGPAELLKQTGILDTI